MLDYMVTKWETSKCFPVPVPLYLLHSRFWRRAPVSPVLLMLVNFILLIINNPIIVKKDLIVILASISLMSNDGECLFTYLLASLPPVQFFWGRLFKNLAHFKLGAFFLNFWVAKVACIVWTQGFSMTWFANIFLHFVSFFFLLWSIYTMKMCHCQGALWLV